MKYTAEEVRARVGFVISDREPRILTWESGGCHPASIAECALWDALAERIKADDRVVPVAWQQKRRPEDYPDEWRECSKAVFDTIKRTKNSPWIARELFAAPPASSSVRVDGSEG